MKELEEISKLQVQNRINIYCFNMGVNQANVTHVGPLLWRGERAGLTEGALRELGVAGSPVRVPHARIFTDSATVRAHQFLWCSLAVRKVHFLYCLVQFTHFKMN